MKIKYFVLLLIIFAAPNLHAAESARLQLAVAAPDPVKAGGEITYQVIIINDGSTNWPAGSYKASVELFDSEQNFIRKLEPAAGNSVVKAGGSQLFLISDRIPEKYWGQYLYRVTVILNGESIFQSDMFPFQVQAISKKEEQEYDWNLRGNFAVSNDIKYYIYKSTSTEDKVKYTGNFAFNTMGNIPLGVFTFNVTGNKPEDDSLELYSIYGTLSSQNSRLEIGDIMPVYMKLVQDGQSGRGVNYIFTPGIFDIGILGMRTVDPIEGTASTNGTYARYAAGFKSGVSLNRNVEFTGSAIRTFDDTDSITAAGPSNTALQSDTAGGKLLVSYGKVDIAADAAVSSSKQESKDEVSASTTAAAFSTEVKYTGTYLRVKGEYYEIQPDFSAPGSPRINSDRKGYNSFVTVRPHKSLNINYTRKYYHDNLGNLPAQEKTTTYQNIDSGSISLNLAGFPSLTLRGGNNDTWSKPAGSIKNNTVSGGLSLGYRFGSSFLSVAGSLSDYKDLTGASSDLLSNVYSVNYFGSLSGRINLNAGYSYNDTENKEYNSNSISNSGSFGITYRWIPGKLNAVLYNSATLRKDDNPQYPTETQDLNSSLEFSYALKKNINLALGGTYTEYEDKTNSNNSYSGYGATIRGLYEF